MIEKKINFTWLSGVIALTEVTIGLDKAEEQMEVECNYEKIERDKISLHPAL